VETIIEVYTDYEERLPKRLPATLKALEF